MSHEYESLPRRVYGDGATFVPVCPTCGRFVKPDAAISLNGLGEVIDEPNATCAGPAGCGRVAMPFEGWF
jgi:hypothetical protein